MCRRRTYNVLDDPGPQLLRRKKRTWSSNAIGSCRYRAGAAYTLGEVDFGELVSPAAALYAGHRFSPVWGMRFGLSGWQSKGAWVSPESVYQYKYLQGNVDVTLDLANLFGKFNYRRTVNPYLFAGVGVNGAFGNDEANALDDQGYTLQNVWSGSKVFVAGRLGLGVDFRFSDCVSFGVELNTNMLSDKYNSKKAGNLDWQFNALAGFTFRFGKNYKKSRPAATAAPVTPAWTTEPAQKEEPAVQEPLPCRLRRRRPPRSRLHCVKISSSVSVRRRSAPPNRRRSQRLPST